VEFTEPVTPMKGTRPIHQSNVEAVVASPIVGTVNKNIEGSRSLPGAAQEFKYSGPLSFSHRHMMMYPAASTARVARRLQNGEVQRELTEFLRDLYPVELT